MEITDLPFVHIWTYTRFEQMHPLPKNHPQLYAKFSWSLLPLQFRRQMKTLFVNYLTNLIYRNL